MPDARDVLRIASDVTFIGAGCTLACSAIWYCYLWHMDLAARRHEFRIRTAVKCVESIVRIMTR